MHLPCGAKPSIAVRCSRVLYKLIDGTKRTQIGKDRLVPHALGAAGLPSLFKLSYRIVFAVATLDTVLVPLLSSCPVLRRLMASKIYDTQHTQPIGIVTAYHLAGVTDLAW